MKVLITGGAGFIGSHLAERLVAEQHEVWVVDNLTTGALYNLPRQGNTANFTFIRGSIGDISTWERIFSQWWPDTIIHCAASFKDPDDWQDHINANIVGTNYLIHFAQKYKPQPKVIYFQTALCYGMGEDDPVKETHELEPSHSSYSISKTTAEYYLRLSGLPLYSFRLANVYGPRNLAGAVPAFYKAISEGKTAKIAPTRRDFVFIGDLVSAVFKVLEGRGDPGIYHLSRGKDIQIGELFSMMNDRMGGKGLHKNLTARVGDAKSILLDPTKANSNLDWEATTPFDIGIKHAIRWYDQYGVKEAHTHLK